MAKILNTRVLNISGSQSFITMGDGGSSRDSKDWWKFGSDNLFPQAIASLNRKATVHRSILKSKSFYIAGQGFSFDEKNIDLADFTARCNAKGQSLRDVIHRLIYDKKGWGNAWLEIVLPMTKAFVCLYHQDTTKVRLSKDKKYALLHHAWSKASPGSKEIKRIPIYPNFEDTGDGMLRSVIHFKEYEPEFENYGLIDWVAGLNVSAIAYKTDKWNVSRLDNSFKASGVMIINGEFESQKELDDFNTEFDTKFIGEGNTGKILKIVQKPGQDPDTMTRYIPIDGTAEGDWKDLHSQSTGDLIIAHNWFRSLTAIADNTGFDTQRILNEYQVALSTVIMGEQQVILDTLNEAMNYIGVLDVSSLAFINKPPLHDKPSYMKIWEARKADGMEYDENDPSQQEYIANISKATIIQVSK